MNPTIEDVKVYWDDRPCNVKHSKKEIGTKEYFDEVERKRYTAEPHIPLFADFPRWRAKKVLEIGSYEGAATSFIINNVNDCEEIFCVDTWEGGVEHEKMDAKSISMKHVEKRFDKNIEIAIKEAKSNVNIKKIKARSDDALINLLSEGKKN